MERLNIGTAMGVVDDKDCLNYLKKTFNLWGDYDYDR